MFFYKFSFDKRFDYLNSARIINDDKGGDCRFVTTYLSNQYIPHRQMEKIKSKWVLFVKCEIYQIEKLEVEIAI